MLIVRTVADLRHQLAGFNKPVFVPTMGNLHQGHLNLLRLGKPLGDVMVASIFVNRLQFLPHEDFASYPRTFENDVEQLQAQGCDVLFAPDEAELYPQPQTFKVHPDPALANILEGEFRPGFFTGVCTVVLKLFHSVFQGGHGVAVFGQKDYQQQLILKHMVQQLAMPIEIVTGATTRAPDGLALSSRNGYLSQPERSEAVQLSVALNTLAQAARNAKTTGLLDVAAAENHAMQSLRNRGWQPDYVTLRHAHDLSQVTRLSDQAMVVLGAARLGSTRLIDNTQV